MTPGMASRPSEEEALSEFLDSASSAPSALLVDGEAGIGKTTVWLAGLERARGRGFQLLSARAANAQPVLAYAPLADLLTGLDPDIWADLPDRQRIAVDRVLRREDAADAVTDQRAVAAAFLSVVDRLADNGPVLLAIDDLQWLDPSTVHVIGFAARRLAGAVGLLATVRTEPDSGDITSWLQLPRPDAIRRITVRPLSSRALHTIVSDVLDRSIPRAAMARIHQVSAGNPFYAIELGRALLESAGEILPSTLAELVRARIGSLDPAVHDVLLAAASLATPTVELVGKAAGTDQVIELLEAAERDGIIFIEGNRIRFAHPLLASGVYTDASPTQRRLMHRRLAGVVDELELRARHLALASTPGDPELLKHLMTRRLPRARAAHRRPRPSCLSWPPRSAATPPNVESVWRGIISTAAIRGGRGSFWNGRLRDCNQDRCTRRRCIHWRSCASTTTVTSRRRNCCSAPLPRTIPIPPCESAC
jgi:hypothetical protein